MAFPIIPGRTNGQRQAAVFFMGNYHELQPAQVGLEAVALGRRLYHQLLVGGAKGLDFEILGKAGNGLMVSFAKGLAG